MYPTPPFTDAMTLPLRDLKNCVFLLSHLFWQSIYRFVIFWPISMNISSEIFKIDMYHYDLLSFYFTKEYPFKFAQSASKYGVYDHDVG